MAKTVANPMVNHTHIDQQLVLHQDVMDLPTLYHPANIDPYHESDEFPLKWSDFQGQTTWRWVGELGSGRVPHPNPSPLLLWPNRGLCSCEIHASPARLGNPTPWISQVLPLMFVGKNNKNHVIKPRIELNLFYHLATIHFWWCWDVLSLGLPQQYR